MADLSVEEGIQLAISQLDENAQRLHTEALEEGFKDEICSKNGCGRIFLAHIDFVMCEPRMECPMISKSLRHENGEPKTMLDMLAEVNPISKPQLNN